MPTLEETVNFIQKYLPFSKEKIINTILNCESIFIVGMNNNLKAIMTYRKISGGHHIHFMIAIDRNSRKLLVKEGIKSGVVPVSAVRYGKLKLYKNPMKLAKRIG